MEGSFSFGSVLPNPENWIIGKTKTGWNMKKNLVKILLFTRLIIRLIIWLLGPNTPEGRNWYPPARLASRWKVAVLDAQKTAHMTRRDRYKSLIVSCGGLKGGLNKKTMPRTVAARKQLLVRREIPSQRSVIHIYTSNLQLTAALAFILSILSIYLNLKIDI